MSAAELQEILAQVEREKKAAHIMRRAQAASTLVLIVVCCAALGVVLADVFLWRP